MNAQQQLKEDIVRICRMLHRKNYLAATDGNVSVRLGDRVLITPSGVHKGYMAAYQDLLNETSTEWAPWYIIPADNKWAMRAIVADIITTTLQDLDLKFPVVTEEQLAKLAEARKKLEAE